MNYCTAPGPGSLLEARGFELIRAGYTVGEAEDIIEHDNGDHGRESVPGCPRCEDGDELELEPDGVHACRGPGCTGEAHI